VLDQVTDIVPNASASSSSPPVLEAALAWPELEKALVNNVRAVIWTGTSMSEETLRVLRDEILSESIVVGLYGNSLMGIAPQRPAVDGDPYPCVFAPYYPYALVEVVEPDSGAPVAHGERGRVRVNLLTRDMFLPNVAERDTAVRVAGPTGDGLAAVRPYRDLAATIIEGVY
jgi:hypothetical protein